MTDAAVVAVAATIARELGGKVADKGGCWRVCCPAHDDATPSLDIRPGRLRVLFRCWAGCPQDEVRRRVLDRSRTAFENEWMIGMNGEGDIKPAAPAAVVGREQQSPPSSASNQRRALAIWHAAECGRGSLAERYLRDARGVATDRLPSIWRALRFHPACSQRRDDGTIERIPALIALFRDALTDRPVAIHRLYLDPISGAKIYKAMLGPVRGAAVKLSPLAPGRPLAVAEGVETALSYMQMHAVPTWAIGSTSLLPFIPTLPDIGELIVAADNDPAGISAADALAARYRAAGKPARIDLPPPGAKDFNDVIKRSP